MQPYEAPAATAFMPVSSKHEALIYQHRPADATAASPATTVVEERRLAPVPVKGQPWVAQPGARRDRWV